MNPAHALNLAGWTSVPDAGLAVVNPAAVAAYRHDASPCVLFKCWMPHTRVAGKGAWMWVVKCRHWCRFVPDGPDLLVRVNNEAACVLRQVEDAR